MDHQKSELTDLHGSEPPRNGEGRPLHHQDPAADVEGLPHPITNGADSIRCDRCRRPLRAPLSVARSSGPVCWRHRQLEVVAA